jgi:hypothetical protein
LGHLREEDGDRAQVRAPEAVAFRTSEHGLGSFANTLELDGVVTAARTR